MRRFEVVLPLPPYECSPNARVHWGRKARAVRDYREVCGYLVVKQIGRRRAQGQVTVDLDFYLAKPKLPDGLCRPRDEDNAIASTKAAIDSLRDSGLITNDSKKHVRIGNVRLHSTKKDHQGRSALVLTVTENNT
jgi:crossover junction endodeoxyribonuclease RusA